MLNVTSRLAIAFLPQKRWQKRRLGVATMQSISSPCSQGLHNEPCIVFLGSLVTVIQETEDQPERHVLLPLDDDLGKLVGRTNLFSLQGVCRY